MERRQASEKKAVLVVSFGTGYRETLEKNIGAIEQAILEAFPGCTVRRAFTSRMIIKKLRERDNVAVDTVEEALERLLAEGVQRVICQPTHIMHGFEYDAFVRRAEAFRPRFLEFRIGRPLLSLDRDYQEAAEAVAKAFPKLGREDALILVGHGTAHPANAAYAALAYRFWQIGYPQVFVGTVEGYPDKEAVLLQVQERHPKTIYLAPFMIVAGDHAVHDLGGRDADSWQTALEQRGYEVQLVLSGLGEIGAVRKIFVDHAKEAEK